MKFLIAIILIAVSCWLGESSAAGQTQDKQLGQEKETAQVFLAPDYFPLNLGNRWIYNKTESRFKKTESVKIEIISAPIIKWKTYYVFNQLPFVPELENANNILVRYDLASRRFVRLNKEGEVPLFPVSEQTDAAFVQAVDAQGHPVPDRLSYLGCLRCENAGTEMVFDRGIGMVGVESTYPWGSENYDLKSADVNRRHFGEVIVAPKKTGKGFKSGPVISRADPILSLETEKVDQGIKLIFKVKNPTEGFLSFNFTSSQSYDFVIKEKQTGFEMWRWSKGNYFTAVARNVALLPTEEWVFEQFWNYRDNEKNDLRRGVYEAVAILTTREPQESAPIEVVVP